MPDRYALLVGPLGQAAQHLVDAADRFAAEFEAATPDEPPSPVQWLDTTEGVTIILVGPGAAAELRSALQMSCPPAVDAAFVESQLGRVVPPRPR